MDNNSKKISVLREDTNCRELLLSKYRDHDGADGVLFIAWHEGEDGPLIQADFVEMDLDIADSFIKDYSERSAEKYVKRFNP